MGYRDYIDSCREISAEYYAKAKGAKSETKRYLLLDAAVQWHGRAALAEAVEATETSAAQVAKSASPEAAAVADMSRFGKLAAALLRELAEQDPAIARRAADLGIRLDE